MGKDQSNKEVFLQAKKEIEEVAPEEWVCMTDCYCSDNGDPIRRRLWRSGEVCWVPKKPSKHFTTREEYNKGTDGRNKHFASYIKYGGIMNDQVRSMPAGILKAVVEQKKREYMRKQATSS